tara:strand:- start:74 stop:1375 length:1302 start_codon:yes stop_codon:yes gene_type:complete
MGFYKFKENDIFRNRIKTNPKVEFFVHRGATYYNNYSVSGSNPSVPEGHLSLYDLNVGRVDSTTEPRQKLLASDVGTFARSELIHSFISKGASQASFKTIAGGPNDTEYFADKQWGDTISLTYPLTASLARHYFSASQGKRERLYALKNTLNYYSYLSPHYKVSSSHLNRDLTASSNVNPERPAGAFGAVPVNLLSIPSIFYGSAIRKGSIELNYYVTGTLVAQAKDKNKNGDIIQVGPPGSRGSGSTIGVALYNEGFMLLTASYNLHGQYLDFFESGVAEKPKWVNFGSKGFSNQRLVSSSFELKFEGTQYISTVTMLAHARKNDLEYSNNPTYKKQGQAIMLSPSGSISKYDSTYPKVYGTTMYIENNEQVAKNIISSSFIDSTGSYKKQTYISKIGIFDKHKNLIAIAKLATPIKKAIDRDLTFKLKLDI